MKNIIILAALALAAWYFIKKKPGTNPVTSLWSGASGLLKSATADSSASPGTATAPRESSRTGRTDGSQTPPPGDNTISTPPSVGGIPGAAVFSKIPNRRLNF